MRSRRDAGRGIACDRAGDLVLNSRGHGHNLGPGEVLVGHQACLGHGGGHTTWTCRGCDGTVDGPPLNIHCTTLDGPATVRNSTQRD